MHPVLLRATHACLPPTAFDAFSRACQARQFDALASPFRPPNFIGGCARTPCGRWKVIPPCVVAPRFAAEIPPPMGFFRSAGKMRGYIFFAERSGSGEDDPLPMERRLCQSRPWRTRRQRENVRRDRCGLRKLPNAAQVEGGKVRLFMRLDTEDPRGKGREGRIW